MEMNMDEVDVLAEKIYLHFKEAHNRSYPLLTEKEKIKDVLRKLKSDPNSFYLVDQDGAEVRGICGYYIIEDEKYLQTMLFASLNRNPTFIRQTLRYLKTTYPNYAINIGVEAENRFVIEELRKSGYRMADDLYSATLNLCDSDSRAYSEVEAIDLAQWDDFAEIHQAAFGEAYWNFDRIKNKFGIWNVFSIREGKRIKAYIFVKNAPDDESCEIFGVYGENYEDQIRLIEHAAASLKDKKRMYYFMGDEKVKEACQELGFVIHGHYQGWEYQAEKEEAEDGDGDVSDEVRADKGGSFIL